MLHRKTPAPPTGGFCDLTQNPSHLFPPVPLKPIHRNHAAADFIADYNPNCAFLQSFSNNLHRISLAFHQSTHQHMQPVQSRKGKGFVQTARRAVRNLRIQKSPVLTIVLFFRCGSHLQLTFLPFQHSSKGADRQNCQLRHLQKKSRQIAGNPAELLFAQVPKNNKNKAYADQHRSACPPKAPNQQTACKRQITSTANSHRFFVRISRK